MSTPTRQPSVDETAPARTVMVRTWPSNPASAVEVTLRASASAPTKSTDEVYVGDRWIGTVSSYTGALDTPTGPNMRLRRPGKERTLWRVQYVDHDGPLHSLVSRAEAIRRLLDDAGLA